THERAVVQAWSIFAMTELEAPAIESQRQREANPEASATAATRCADALAALEGALPGTPPYLVGSRLTVADIVAGGVLGVAVRIGAIEPSPTTAAYMSRPPRGPPGSGHRRNWAHAGLSRPGQRDSRPTPKPCLRVGRVPIRLIVASPNGR